MSEPTRNEGNAYLRQIQQRVARLGLQNQVHFRCFQANLAMFNHAIDAFLMASENETYGMVTLEALASGVPVVGAAAGGTAELVAHNQTGLLYLPGDVAACARAIGRTFAEPAATHERVERARLARWHYSHHRQCALTEDVIWAVAVAPVATPRAARLRRLSVNAAFACAVT